MDCFDYINFKWKLDKLDLREEGIEHIEIEPNEDRMNTYYVDIYTTMSKEKGKKWFDNFIHYMIPFVNPEDFSWVMFKGHKMRPLERFDRENLKKL